MLIQFFYLKLQIFSKDADKDTVILLSARASRVENQDAIDASIVGMLGDPKEVSVLVLVIIISSFHLQSGYKRKLCHFAMFLAL